MANEVNDFTGTTSMSPEDYASWETSKAGSEYGDFNTPFSGFVDEATGEIDPLYNTVQNELSGLEANAITDNAETYDDLLENMKEGYNQRGTFFSGEAMTGEADLGIERGRAETGIRSGYATQRAGIASQKMSDIQTRADTLRQNAYNDWTQQKTDAIQTTVFNKLKEWYPEHQKYLDEQDAKADALFWDVPMDGETGDGTADTTEAPTTQVKPHEGKNIEAEQISIGNFGALTNKQPSTPQEWEFVNVATYGYNGQKDKEKEKIAGDLFRQKFKKNPSTQEDWNLIHAMAYVDIN